MTDEEIDRASDDANLSRARLNDILMAADRRETAAHEEYEREERAREERENREDEVIRAELALMDAMDSTFDLLKQYGPTAKFSIFLDEDGSYCFQSWSDNGDGGTEHGSLLELLRGDLDADL